MNSDEGIEEIEGFSGNSEDEVEQKDGGTSSIKCYARRTLELHSELLCTNSYGTTTDLRQHQQEAVAWMVARETSRAESTPRQHLSGGILADECGMGKTLTMLAHISSQLQRQQHCSQCRTTLIICPSSLVSQWVKEIKRHTSLVPLAFNGPKQSRNRKINSDPYMFTKYDVVITTFRNVT